MRIYIRERKIPYFLVDMQYLNLKHIYGNKFGIITKISYHLNPLSLNSVKRGKCDTKSQSYTSINDIANISKDIGFKF